jgi:hypothetical protein
MSRALRLVVLTLALGAGSAAARKPKHESPPPAPASVETSWYAAPRPAGDGWLAIDRSGDDVILVRDGAGDAGAGPGDSWSAQVLVTPPLSDGTPKGMTASLERDYRDRLLLNGRFELVGWKAEADAARAAICVRYRLATIDREAYLGGSTTDDVMLVEDGLACDVARPADGAVIAKMSWRGTNTAVAEQLDARFDAWLSGIGIVGAPLRAGGDVSPTASRP